jgi:hypothetical protein
MDPTQQPQQQPVTSQPVQQQPVMNQPYQPQPAASASAQQQYAQPAGTQPAAGVDPKMRIDDNMLVELGLGSLGAQDKDDLLKQIYQTLQIRVGMKLAERMSDAQLKEFEQFINNKDDAGALRWLETNFPDYKQVVANELNALKEELKRDADKILAAALQQPQPQAASAQTIQQQQPPAPQPPLQ